MRILLIYPILDCQPVAPVGIASLATQLNKAGHKVKLIIINNELGYPLDPKRIYRDLCKFSADIIAFSSVNSQYEVVIKIADYLRSKINIPVIYGGPCPTVMPEKCLRNKSIDFVCVGEGEEAFIEFLDKYKNGKNYFDIPNIWFKQNGKMIKNPVRPPMDIKNLYPIDFSVFEEMKKILKCRDGWFDYSLIRGCPFNCSHCQSAYIHKIYKNKYYVRHAPIDIVIDNLKEIIAKYKGSIDFFNFNDDTFNLNKKYLSEFCDKYKKYIFKKHGIKFNVLCRVDLFDEETCKKLKEAGVRIVKFGVESGSPRIRKQILNRNIKDKTIINAFRICDKYKVETWAFNMIGLPTETRKNLYSTFKLNSIIKPDNFWLSIYYPIEKTELYEFCSRNKLIKYNMLKELRNYRTDSPIVSKHFEKGEIQTIYKIAGWILNLYAFPRHKDKFGKLIKKVFNLKKDGAKNESMDKFINDSNKKLDKSLNTPYYNQRFKHIAIKITNNAHV
ncbi:MAG: radical SAM protein [Candidatus Omnitrophica bacterium]|nr:radical SAM protein [Candidatus Omnitrophota bacterium]MDD5352360.1 radical SAM protein [Candidatus Omnitrophota bacterium]MDD5549958.1 radical SAM protein [Candidatus Omnitrophota bacterium]